MLKSVGGKGSARGLVALGGLKVEEVDVQGSWVTPGIVSL